MSEDTDTAIVKPEREEETQAAAQKKSRAGLAISLVVLVLLALAAAAYFARQALQDVAEREQAERSGLSAQVAALEKNIADLKAQQTARLADIDALSKEQAELRESIAVLYHGQNYPEQEWALAEVEYLLLIAAHRLALEADVDTALVAMQAADSRLQGLPDPALLAVRRQLAADMNALRAAVSVDISGLALYLADLIERTDSLALKTPEIKIAPAAATAKELEDPTAPWWRRLLSSIWRELKGVIVISHEGERAELALLPQQAFYLRQNLRLQLEAARYAVLQRDTALLHSAIATITAWLGRYFAVSDRSISNIVESLAQMRALDLQPALPDVSSSLESLRAYIRADRPGANARENEPPENEAAAP